MPLIQLRYKMLLSGEGPYAKPTLAPLVEKNRRRERRRRAFALDRT